MKYTAFISLPVNVYMVKALKQVQDWELWNLICYTATHCEKITKAKQDILRFSYSILLYCAQRIAYAVDPYVLFTVFFSPFGCEMMVC